MFVQLPTIPTRPNQSDLHKIDEIWIGSGVEDADKTVMRFGDRCIMTVDGSPQTYGLVDRYHLFYSPRYGEIDGQGWFQALDEEADKEWTIYKCNPLSSWVACSAVFAGYAPFAWEIPSAYWREEEGNYHVSGDIFFSFSGLPNKNEDVEMRLPFSDASADTIAQKWPRLERDIEGSIDGSVAGYYVAEDGLRIEDKIVGIPVWETGDETWKRTLSRPYRYGPLFPSAEIWRTPEDEDGIWCETSAEPQIKTDIDLDVYKMEDGQKIHVGSKTMNWKGFEIGEHFDEGIFADAVINRPYLSGEYDDETSGAVRYGAKTYRDPSGEWRYTMPSGAGWNGIWTSENANFDDTLFYAEIKYAILERAEAAQIKSGAVKTFFENGDTTPGTPIKAEWFTLCRNAINQLIPNYINMDFPYSTAASALSTDLGGFPRNWSIKDFAQSQDFSGFFVDPVPGSRVEDAGNFLHGAKNVLDKLYCIPGVSAYGKKITQNGLGLSNDNGEEAFADAINTSISAETSGLSYILHDFVKGNTVLDLEWRHPSFGSEEWEKYKWTMGVESENTHIDKALQPCVRAKECDLCARIFAWETYDTLNPIHPGEKIVYDPQVFDDLNTDYPRGLSTFKITIDDNNNGVIDRDFGSPASALVPAEDSQDPSHYPPDTSRIYSEHGYQAKIAYYLDYSRPITQRGFRYLTPPGA